MWKYQRYMEDYLACVASVDDNVGRVTSWLRASGQFEDTLLMYTSDQGFFLLNPAPQNPKASASPTGTNKTPITSPSPRKPTATPTVHYAWSSPTFINN